MLPHKLSLKKDAVVILLRNLNLKEGLRNGTRLKNNQDGTPRISSKNINR